jgi:transposase-like protein
MYIRYPLSLRQVEDLLFERGIDICHESVRFWWNRFGPMFAAEIRKRRVDHRSYSRWRWHLDEVFVRINGKTHYLWRAVDHEGEVLEVLATKRRDRTAVLKFLKRKMKRHGGGTGSVHCSRPRSGTGESGTTDVIRGGDGSTTGSRTRIRRSDDESGRWRNSGT